MGDVTPVLRHRNEGPGGCVPWEDHMRALDALAIRVRPGPPMWKTGGQTTCWIENDEHEAALALLAAHGRLPLGGSNPTDRERNAS